MAEMKPNLGQLKGRGTITRADGTKVEFTVSSDITKEQAERLNLKPSNTEDSQENK